MTREGGFRSWRDDRLVAVELPYGNAAYSMLVLMPTRDPVGSFVATLDTAPMPKPKADGIVTATPGLALSVLTADCLPVLFCNTQGTEVAAAHAGWRGLAGGVLEATVAALCEAAACAPDRLQAWLGPCIGPREFEVGADVLAAFGASTARPDPARFVSRPRADGAPRWRANLPQLARDRLLDVPCDEPRPTGTG